MYSKVPYKTFFPNFFPSLFSYSSSFFLVFSITEVAPEKNIFVLTNNKNKNNVRKNERATKRKRREDTSSNVKFTLERACVPPGFVWCCFHLIPPLDPISKFSLGTLHNIPYISDCDSQLGLRGPRVLPISTFPWFLYLFDHLGVLPNICKT